MRESKNLEGAFKAHPPPPRSYRVKMSLDSGDIPAIFKLAAVIPIFKGEDQTIVPYGHISYTSFHETLSAYYLQASGFCFECKQFT